MNVGKARNFKGSGIWDFIFWIFSEMYECSVDKTLKSQTCTETAKNI